MTADQDPTYYDRPVLKETVWKWYIPAYIVTGGIAGASATIAAAADLLRAGEHDGLVRRARRVGVVAIGAGTVCLVADLGRPARAMNMLRVVRPSSPMNVGSWLLALFAPAVGASAVLPVGARGRGLGRAAGVVAGLAGAPVAGYTGVLLAATAVPAWQAAGRSLPPLFAGSALAGAASVLELWPGEGAESAVLRRCAVVGGMAELAASIALEVELRPVAAVVQPYRRGTSAVCWRLGQVCTALSLVWAVTSRRRLRRAAALTGLAGSVLLKWGVFEAGRASARDPRATFHLQRARGVARSLRSRIDNLLSMPLLGCRWRDR